MLQKILQFLFYPSHVTITGNTRFAFGVDWRGWIVPVVIALALVGWWSYRRQSTSPRKRVVLGILRTVLLAAVFLLFCRPQLVLDSEEHTRSVVAVWVDPSMSMTLEDPYNKDTAMRDLSHQAATRLHLPAGQVRPSRYQLAVDALANAKWLKTLTETQDVMFFKGSTHAVEVGTGHSPEQVQQWVDKLKAETPTGESTDVPTVVQEIHAESAGARVSAIVLLTDGQTTRRARGSIRPSGSAEHSSVKVFSLPLGEEAEPFNLQDRGMQVPETAFVRDPVLVKVHLSGSGIDQPTPVR